MEPVTHLLTGGCLARAGFNRKAAYATITMVIAAEFPDIDTLWGLSGPVELFQHHRGITHTFLGLPFEAALIVAGVYGWHRWRLLQAGGKNRTAADATVRNSASDKTRYRRNAVWGQSSQSLPVRWGVLYGLAMLGLLSHLLLDYTNNYGLRPFFPFVDKWYAASIVFIFDPVMFAILLGALTLPWLFGLVGTEVGARRQRFPARGWGIAALLGVAAWWGLREVEHARAVTMAMAQSIAAPVENQSVLPLPQARDTEGTGAMAASDEVPRYLGVRRALASPDPMSPFRWSAAMDFGPIYQLAEIDTSGRGTLTLGQTTYPKPGRSAAVMEAERSRLGRAYMDWSPMPIVDVTRPDSALAGEGAGDVAKVVTFRDPRFMGGWMRGQGGSGLEGSVWLSADGRVAGETMGGRVEGSF
jgi:inner membrane protein